MKLQPSPAEDQPYGVEIKMADGVFVKQMAFRRVGSIVPQHAHTYEHVSMLARGSIRAWAGKEYLGEFHAPTGITIKAGVKHSFVTLEPFTVIYCIHRIDRTGEIEIEAENCLAECDQCLLHGSEPPPPSREQSEA